MRQIKDVLILVIVVMAPVVCSVRILNSGNLLSPIPDSLMPWPKWEAETRCYDVLGCLNITSDWTHLTRRPVSVFPLRRDIINTTFILFTRSNPGTGQIIAVEKEESIRQSNFDSRKLTKFIIHGFVTSPDSSWIQEMITEFLKHGDYNVIVVDWSGGNRPPYFQATANTRLVGLEIAHLIEHLQKKYRLDVNNVHLIGHSLGAHTAGYAGEKLGGSVGRITGLDPAEPYFENMPSHLRLDRTDAKFVDVIHTDARSISLPVLGRALPKLAPISGYGVGQPCGHLDFYPNGGKSQPGCMALSERIPFLPLTLISDGVEDVARYLGACNHHRAVKLFTATINGRCPWIARECNDYDSFLRSECLSCNGTRNCGIMGYRADLSPALIKRQLMARISSVPDSRFFVSTTKEEPFCS